MYIFRCPRFILPAYVILFGLVKFRHIYDPVHWDRWSHSVFPSSFGQLEGHMQPYAQDIYTILFGVHVQVSYCKFPP